MLREMSYDDFLTWQAFDRMSPIGDQRGDWQAASICSAIFNAMAIRARSDKRFATSDFLLEFTDEGLKKKQEDTTPAPSQDWQRMKFIARMFTAQANTDEEKRQSRGRRR
jgi:hypothetical protein